MQLYYVGQELQLWNVNHAFSNNNKQHKKSQSLQDLGVIRNDNKVPFFYKQLSKKQK
jgi:hypothetical protein